MGNPDYDVKITGTAGNFRVQAGCVDQFVGTATLEALMKAAAEALARKDGPQYPCFVAVAGPNHPSISSWGKWDNGDNGRLWGDSLQIEGNRVQLYKGGVRQATLGVDNYWYFALATSESTFPPLR